VIEDLARTGASADEWGEILKLAQPLLTPKK
jgi:hypothetical protein